MRAITSFCLVCLLVLVGAGFWALQAGPLRADAGEEGIAVAEPPPTVEPAAGGVEPADTSAPGGGGTAGSVTADTPPEDGGAPPPPDGPTADSPSPDSGSTPAPGAAPPPPEPAPATAPAAPVSGARSPEQEGWRISIPAIGVDAAMVTIGLEADGSMGAPATPDVAGWYLYGPAPGEPGNVLVDGHVDWTNPNTGIPFTGVFWGLRQLTSGDRVIINDGARDHAYHVVEKRTYRADDPAGVEVLQPTDDSRLTLITCGGIFDRATHSYLSREVVIAQYDG